jgi:hypothetical protein
MIDTSEAARALSAQRWGPQRAVRIARELSARADELPEVERRRLLEALQNQPGQDLAELLANQPSQQDYAELLANQPSQQDVAETLRLLDEHTSERAT